MSELHTFFASPEQFSSDSILLQGQECKHLASVLRLKPGTDVQVLDGQGRTALAIVQTVSKREAVLSIREVHETPRPASLPIIALAFSKAARRGFFLEKAVELGACEVWVWQGEHSQGRLPDDVRDSWQSKMIAGCKQSSNPWLPAVRSFPQGLAQVIAQAADFEHHLLPWEMQQGVPMLTLDDMGRAGRTIYIIGPEGGFSTRELELLAEAGYKAVSLGQRILRCETAATLCLGLHWWASQQAGRPDAPQAQ